MTRNKDFKALARARMRRTGETYTAARAAMLLESAVIRPSPDQAIDAAREEQQRVVDRMFAAGRLTAIPAKRKLRAAVLLEILAHFEPGHEYPERAVSEQLATFHEDFAYLRRELVGFGYLQRSDGRYWVSPQPPARTDQQRRELPAWEAAWLPDFVARQAKEQAGEVA